MLRAFFTFSLLLSFPAHGAALVGVWTSDCQNVSNRAGTYKSRAPVDTFLSDGRASLRVRVFEEPDCKGKEWDEERIGCIYHVGDFVPGLKNTRELDLVCKLDNKMYRWYEIAEVTEHTLRFGNSTGELPEYRPKALGSVYYRR